MLNRERPRGLRLRLEIQHEANALSLDSGAKAYSVACQRALEASSDEISDDWERCRGCDWTQDEKAPVLLAYVFH